MSAAIVKLVGDKVLNGSNLVSTAEVLKDKLVALYFSAHWCPPCRQFTPEFSRIYTTLTSNNKAIAVVFISADQDAEAFNEYYGEQPWYAVPYDDQDRRDSLNEAFGIRSIPTLVVLDKEGQLITKEGRSDVMKLKDKAIDNWEQKAHKETAQA